jgi:hypothetical protein
LRAKFPFAAALRWRIHGISATPLEETLEALDTLVRSGKVRYVGISNFAGWQLMKTLAVAERHRFVRPVSQQLHYTLQAREAENELAPIALASREGTKVRRPCSSLSHFRHFRSFYRECAKDRKLHFRDVGDPAEGFLTVF